jgi:protein-disulfide isomerase
MFAKRWLVVATALAASAIVVLAAVGCGGGGSDSGREITQAQFAAAQDDDSIRTLSDVEAALGAPTWRGVSEAARQIGGQEWMLLGKMTPDSSGGFSDAECIFYKVADSSASGGFGVASFCSSDEGRSKAAFLITPQAPPPGATTAPAQSGTVQGASETAALLAGIPQRGTRLGSPDAPVTLVEYADLQCPYCAEWAQKVLPVIVRDYVRPEKVQLEFRGLAFIGPDSTVALRTVLAAAAQNRLWNTLDLIYRNQGTENTGWLTDPFVRRVLAAVPGLDVDRVLAERESAAITTRLNGMTRQAAAAEIASTPTFQVGRTGGALRALTVEYLDVSSFKGPLDKALAASASAAIPGSKKPFTVASFKIKFFNVGGNDAFEAAGQKPSQESLVIQIEVLSGSASQFSTIEAWVTDENARRSDIGAATLTGTKLVTWYFNVPTTSREFLLHFPTGEIVDLSPLLR